MTKRQIEVLRDLFACVADTDAATPAQRIRAGELADRLGWELYLARF